MAMSRSSATAPDSPDSKPWPHFVFPKIWWKGPEEHIRGSRHATRVRSTRLPYWRSDAPAKYPPPNHVRVLFWWTLEDLKTSRPKAEVSVDVPLDPNGCLDLILVQRTLGLEGVSIIHPLKWKIFEPANPNLLSALAVHDLALQNHIFVTEGIPTFNTSLKRVIRLFCIDIYCSSVFGLYSLLVRGGYDSKLYIPVPEWYDSAVDYRNDVISRAKELNRELNLICRFIWVYSYQSFGLGTPNSIEQDTEGPLIEEWITIYAARRSRFIKLLAWAVLLFLLFLVYFVDQFLIHIF